MDSCADNLNFNDFTFETFHNRFARLYETENKRKAIFQDNSPLAFPYSFHEFGWLKLSKLLVEAVVYKILTSKSTCLSKLGRINVYF